MWILVAVIVVVLVLAAGVAVIALRRSRTAPPPPIAVEPEEDPAVREARHHAIDEQGSELLERRVELDTRRGTLAGDDEVNDAFDELLKRLRSGEITEEQFEGEKVRLLSGE
ncbi:MAG TPA: hypothetical protein VF221_03580 [Chloroflexota bacterium]